MEVFIVVVTVVLVFWWLRSNRSHLKLVKALPNGQNQMLFRHVLWVMKSYTKKMEYGPSVDILQRIVGVNRLFRNEGLVAHRLGSETIVSVLSPDLIEKVLSSSTLLEKSFEYSFLHTWLGTGLLTSTGSKWRSRRKLLTPCFHFRILEDFLDTFHEHSIVLVKKLVASKDQEYVDITPLILLCTLDIVCETVMGAHIGAQKGNNLEYVKAVHNLGDFFNQRTLRPWLWSDRLFFLTSLGRSFAKDLRTVHGFTQKVIKEKKIARQHTHNDHEQNNDASEIRKRQALMDLLLDLHVDGQHLSEGDIQEEVDTFMFEGHDTTAMGITFALYCIGLYPDIQAKLRIELDAIFGTDRDRPASMDDVRNMKYLECVLKESQRIYPSVPMIGRKLNEDIFYKNYVIPKNTTVHFNIISLHHRSDIFQDPDVFDPNRFDTDVIRERHPYAFVPFSAGPRNCIGQKFAMLEEKIVISNILRHLIVHSLDPRDRLLQKIEFTLRPARPVRLKFTSRS